VSTENQWAIVCPNCKKRYAWTGALSPIPPCPHCLKEKKDAKAGVDEALALAEEIENLAAEIPAEGEDFGLSVTEKAADIAKNIEKHGRVTDGQMTALENMLCGLQKWFHD
jgi:hypothetical protein